MQKQHHGRGASEEVILVAVPVQHKRLVEPIEAMIRATERACASGRGGRAIDYAEVETTMAERTAELERAAHAEVLAALDIDSPRIVVCGKTYTRIIASSPGTYYTMAGPVEVKRALYREDGVRNGPSVDTISLRAGTYGRGWLPQTAQAIAHEVQRGPSRDAAASARQSGRLPYCRAVFETVAHEVGTAWDRVHADIEDSLIDEMEIPDEAYSVSTSLDRTAVPMEEPASRPVGRPRKGAAKRPVKRVWHMAYCGTVTLHDKNGRALHSIRYACMPDGDPRLLCDCMANDVGRLLERRPWLRIKLLADGADEMWNLLNQAFPPRLFGEVERGVDFWHVIEKLSPAAKCLFGDDRAQAELYRWRDRLLRTDKAAAEILAQLRASGHEWTWLDSKQPVHAAITYLENKMDRMNYATARQRGMPIGSGNCEATCKTVVGVRMKRAGSRWKHETGQHILQLRALATSDRFESAMSKLHATRRNAVRPAA